MERDRQKWIVTVCMGLCAGIVSALVFLNLLQMTGFSMKSISYIFVMITAFFLPWCLNWCEKWVVSVRITQWIMVSVHVIIAILYTYTVVSSGTQFNLLLSAFMTGAMEGLGVLSLCVEKMITEHKK